jgi:lipopolysaccharide export system permease protein
MGSGPRPGAGGKRLPLRPGIEPDAAGGSYNRLLLRIVDQLALRELRAPLLFGIAMFSMLTIATVVLQEAARFVIRFNLPAAMFFKIFALSAPQFIVLSVPMGALLGTLIAVGRLSSDQEVTALRACGVSIYRLLAPFFLVGFLLSVITFIGSERLVPYCNSTLKVIQNNVRTGKVGQAKQQRVSLPIREDGDLRWLLIADSVEGDKLTKVKLFYFHNTDDYKDFYVTASSAIWKHDDWEFQDMRMVSLRPGDEPVVLEGEAKVPGFKITPKSMGIRMKTPDDLTIIQLSNLIRELLKADNKPGDKEILDYRTRLWFKYAIPLTPMFFMLLAVPLAITSQRSSNVMGMGIAILIVLLYYVAYTVCQKLGATGVLPPIVAGWLPNAALFGTSIALVARRERN